MAHHNLKIFTDFYQVVVDGLKKSEIRHNDRGYQIGDTITLHEGWLDVDVDGGFHYTGRKVSAVVSHINTFGCQSGYVCLSLDRVGLTIIGDSNG